MQRALNDPSAMAALAEVASNPRALAAMRDITQNGAAAMAKYANDEEVMAALDKLQRALGN